MCDYKTYNYTLMYRYYNNALMLMTIALKNLIIVLFI